jgi:hypothetical protein
VSVVPVEISNDDLAMAALESSSTFHWRRMVLQAQKTPQGHGRPRGLF